MKQRRTIVILGTLAAVLVLAVTGLAIFFLHSLEKEKNRLMTDPARKNRWKQPEQPKVEVSEDQNLNNETVTTPVENSGTTV
jgi:flagellar biogenesis protein FliO